MENIQNIDVIKYLLSIILIVAGFNATIIGFMARKYIKRSDDDHRRLNQLEGEHCLFRKEETNIIRK